MDPIAIAAPVAAVTVLEDRAQVERRGKVSLVVGRQKLRIPGVTALLVDRSLKAALPGAAVVDVRAVRAWKEKPRGGLASDASDLKKRIHALERDHDQRAAAVTRLGTRVGLVAAAIEEVLREVQETAGAGTGVPARWKEKLAKLRVEEDSSREGLRQAEREVARVLSRLSEARTALAQAEHKEDALETALEVTVEAKEPRESELSVAYLVPCAAWRPAYRATLRKDAQASIAVETQGVVWQRTGEAWTDIALTFSTARPALGAAPPSLVEDWLSLRDKTSEEKKTIAVAMREEDIRTTGEGGVSRAEDMPGVDDGGEVRVLVAPGKASVPADGLPYRVALSRFEAPAQVELLCTPEHGPLATTVARFENKGKDVLLAGPVDLVLSSGFIGRGLLKFAAPGEKVRLCFGSDDALRVSRYVDEKRAEAAITGKQTITREVKLFVSNAGGAPQRLVVEERIPVSEIEAVEVKRTAEKGYLEPTTVVEKDGVLRFDLALGPRERKEVRFGYQIVAGAKVAGL
jgi:uncharacterized protein (TIGR02231 family)